MGSAIDNNDNEGGKVKKKAEKKKKRKKNVSAVDTRGTWICPQLAEEMHEQNVTPSPMGLQLSTQDT